MNVLEHFYGKDLEFSVLFDKYLEHVKTIKNYYKENYGASFTDCRRIDKRNLGKKIGRKIALGPESKQLALIDKSDLLVSSDYNSLYPLAMAQLDSKWTEKETAEVVDIEGSDRVCTLFNNGDWKSLYKSGFFKVRYCNPNEIIFQHMSVKKMYSTIARTDVKKSTVSEMVI